MTGTQPVGFNGRVFARVAWIWAGVVVVLLATSCASADDATPGSSTTSSAPEATTTEAPDPVGGVLAEIGTNRLYSVNRAFGLALWNVGDEPVVVEQVQLDSDQFVTVPIVDRDATLQPHGRRFVLPLPYGEVRCDVEPADTFEVVVAVAGGAELRLDATEEYAGAVGRLHARECATADVLERVDITFGDEWAQDGITTSGELRMSQRHPGEPVAMDDAVGNVIFTLALEEAHPVVGVTDEAPRASVPVTISADRCDPHAVAEFKRPYVFLSWVAVGDGDPVPVELVLTGRARQALVDLIATCST
jgi:hypothetical protein